MLFKHVAAATKGHLVHGIRLGLIWSKKPSELWLVGMSGPQEPVQLLCSWSAFPGNVDVVLWDGGITCEFRPGQETWWEHPVDSGNCSSPDLVCFGVQASISKHVFKQKVLTAFCWGLGSTSTRWQATPSAERRAGCSSRLQPSNTQARPQPSPASWDFWQGLAHPFVACVKVSGSLFLFSFHPLAPPPLCRQMRSL